MAVLVLGAYGLIGRAVVARLVAQGFEVIGLGRDIAAAARMTPAVVWRKADIAKLTTATDWAPLLIDVDAIVNASGALQTGLKDDVTAVQTKAMTALFEAASGADVANFVQISAPGADPDASTLFMRSKSVADAALVASGLPFVILRPALVIAPTAYGGTALLRALAAFPGFVPLVLGGTRIRTVGIDELADAVVQSLEGSIPAGSDVALAEPGSHTLEETVTLLRRWLGYRPAPVVHLPDFLGPPIAATADALGWLSWRSPLRSTALAVMQDGVAPNHAGTARDLAGTLAAMPSSPQDRWFARLWLLKPVTFGLLSIFWIASGLIGFAQRDAASRILTEAGVAEQTALAAVLAGSLADIAVGLAVLVRPFARFALSAMLAITGAYIAGSAILAPQLWLDPLGAMVKTLPLIVLILVALAILEDR